MFSCSYQYCCKLVKFQVDINIALDSYQKAFIVLQSTITYDRINY